MFSVAADTGDVELYKIASDHAHKVLKSHIKGDFSQWHVVAFDESNGDIVKRETWQGYSDNSAWSRGQAWAVYGFTSAYRWTNEKIFLETAQKMADYFFERLPSDGIPPWYVQSKPKDDLC